MAKGYLVAEVTITDPAAFAAYEALVGPVIARFGGVSIVRTSDVKTLEGASPEGRVVVLEFPDLASVDTFYTSRDYQAIAPMRDAAARSRVFIVEGTAR